jgi:hypothetical protein
MELGDLASAPIVEMTLLLGGLLAMASAVVGHKEGNTMGNVLVWVGFIAGAFILIVGLVALTIRSGAWPASTIIILFVLGLGLFMHLIKKVKWAALIALIVGTGIGYGLYQLAKAINFTWLLDNTIVIVVIAFVIMIIIYAMLKFFEDVVSIAGGILSFRPIMFIAGVLAMLEGTLLLLNTSITGLLK